MGGFLRQNTSRSIKFGPFLDSGDGVTPETALVIAQSDMQLSKDGGAFAQKNASGNAAHDARGWYGTTLNATDTNTVGRLQFDCQIAGAVPVWDEWTVLEEAVYDALFASTAAGYSTFNPATDTVANVTTVSSVTNPVSANVTAWQGLTIPGANMIENDAGDGRWTAQALEQAPSGGGGLTSQDVRDAMKLAPTAGAPAAGSVDLHLDDIQAKTDGLNYTGAFVQADVQAYDGNTAAVKLGATSALPQMDAAAINDSPPAALNLADFATAGYDPATNQVNGVKLVDTTTTNTDMRGTDSASTHTAADVWAVGTRGLTETADANVIQWQGFTIPGAVMIEDNGAGDGRWTATAMSSVTSGFVQDDWRWSTDTTATDPTEGRVKGNNATLASITALYISEISNSEANALTYLQALSPGDLVLVSEVGNGSNFIRGEVTSAVDNGGWWTLNVTSVEAGGSISNNRQTTVVFGFIAATAAVVADAVWNAERSTHTVAGSFGEYAPSDVTHWQGFAIPGASMIENDGSGNGRYTTKALEQAPSAAGGTDWTAAERNQIRDAMGVDGTKTAATGGQLQNKMDTSHINATAGKVNGVALVDVTTTNTDMRGTDGANTATPLTLQQTADAARITPTGTINAGSVDEKLTTITTTGGPGPWTTGTAANANSEIRLLSPTVFQTPASGTVTFTVYVFSRDETGAPVATDAAPVFTAEDFTGASLDANWAGPATNPAVGEYRRQYNVASTHPLGDILFRASAAIATEPRESGDITTIVEEEAGLQPGDLNQIRYRLQLDGVQTAPAVDAPLQLPVDVGAWSGSTAAVKVGPSSGLPEVELPAFEQQALATVVLDTEVEPNRTLRESQRIILASAAGKLSGAATPNVLIRDTNDTKNRISATVDADGNRIAVTLDDT